MREWIDWGEGTPAPVRWRVMRSETAAWTARGSGSAERMAKGSTGRAGWSRKPRTASAGTRRRAQPC